MRLRLIVRGLLYAAIVLVFVGSLLAIGITGPVVVRSPRLDLEVEISPERLRRDVERLAGELAPRDFRSTENLNRTAAWIAAELRAAGLEVESQEYGISRGRFRNVIGLRRGIDPSAPVRVLGAHYDAVEGSPGANDNASGVAALLELVRTLPPERPRRSQYFVAFATEEPPFFGSDEMGSHHFADGLRQAGIEVDLMIALDLVGCFSDERGSQRFPVPGLGLLYPGRGDFITVVGDLRSGSAIKQVKRYLRSMTDLPVESFRGPASMAGVLWSDHRSFRELDMPAVLITDTAFLRYDYYHDGDDTPNKLDYQRMAEVVRGLHGVVWDRDVAD